MNGAEILIEQLVELGVKTVFGYPGGAVLNIYDELYKNSHRIEHIITAHEQGAAHAADGYARVTGEVGVVIATSGPGATNLVTGIANAYLDSIPIVAITGNVATNLLGRDSFQEVDIVGITLPIVKHNYVVKDVSELESVIKEAFAIAKSGRPGPVLIDIPKDIQAAECKDKIDNVMHIKPKYVNSIESFKEVAKLINECERPYIYCGGGVVLSGASNEVLELSKKISSPIGLSMMGLTAIPNSYELNLGMTGMHGKYAASKVKSESDLIIAIGVRFSDRATGNKNAYAKDHKIIHIDIDPAEVNKNISATIELCGDVKIILNQLLELVQEKHSKEWLELIEKQKEKQHSFEDKSDGLNPKNAIELVNTYCEKDTAIVTDVGQHQMWVMQHYKFEKPRTLATSGGLGTMGFGMGAAIGSSIGLGRKKTVLFTGDGSFGMNLNEMATVVSQNLPLVIIVMNNGVLGMVRQWQTAFYGKRYSQTTLNRKTDFVKLANAFGANGYRANTLEELKDILDKHFADDTPLLIDCMLDMDGKVLPMIPPGASIDEIIVQ